MQAVARHFCDSVKCTTTQIPYSVDCLDFESRSMSCRRFSLGAALLAVVSGQLLCGTAVQGDFPADAANMRVDDKLSVSPEDWPWWRGPLRNGTANSAQNPPTQFSSDENVLWVTDVPGRGYSSPTVVGSAVLITTSDEEVGSQSVLCFDRESGNRRWSKTVHESGGMRKNNKSTMASSTVACDGERVYVSFPNAGQLVATALDMQGEIVWQQAVCDYQVHQGYGASPALYQDLVIVSADNKLGGAIEAFNRQTGETVWHQVRPKDPNYPSPTLLHVAGQDQLIMVGCNEVISYQPLTGKVNWQTEGATTECVTSTITDGKLVYTSGGYPKNHMSAVVADGSNEVVWSNTERLYVPSLVIKEGYLYGVLDAGIAMCWKADSGKEMWKARLGGTYSSSPVLVGEQIFVTSETTEFHIFKAQPAGFEKIATNKLGDQILATPTICGSRIYHRVTHLDDSGNRQEKLYCIAEE